MPVAPWGWHTIVIPLGNAGLRPAAKHGGVGTVVALIHWQASCQCHPSQWCRARVAGASIAPFGGLGFARTLTPGFAALTLGYIPPPLRG